jgi:hypothetical protein
LNRIDGALVREYDHEILLLEMLAAPVRMQVPMRSGSNMTLIQRLLDKVRGGNISQAEAAREVGVSRQRIHQMMHEPVPEPAPKERKPRKPRDPRDYASNRIFDGSQPLSAAHAERAQRAYDRARLEPEILLSDKLYKHDDALRLIFEGLQQHYIECVTSGRLEAWARAAHAAVELLSDVPDVEFAQRKMIGFFNQLSDEQKTAALAYRGPDC